MASTTKKRAGKTKSKPRSPVAKRSPAKQTQTVEALRRELAEALEQQKATSDILRMIARAPGDLQTVMDAIAENAARLCDADDVLVRRIDGENYYLVSHFGSIPIVVGMGVNIRIDRSTPAGRAVVDRKTIHVHDLAAAEAEFPGAKTRGIAVGVRTALVAPLLRDGTAIGSIHIRRTEVRPFTDKQIKLLETFADQAVIAIENVRLFNELQSRNRDLTEALEQQTATSEILRVIASSPTDIQPVLETVATNAARLSGATDAQIRLVEGNGTRLVASFGPLPAPNFMPTNLGNPAGRAILQRQQIHVQDLRASSEFPGSAERSKRTGTRTFLSTPMVREGVPIGLINIRRTEVRPFSDKQIALLKTFADQAVIAIENVRLFQELTESLERQTATSEILGVIASSPTDIQPVLDVVAENAARLCDATDAVINRQDGDLSRIVASYGSIPVPRAIVEGFPGLTRGTPAGRAMLDRKTIHVHDLVAEMDADFPDSKTRQQISGTRTILVAPLLREGVSIGCIVIRRLEVRPFTDKQIALLQTFADQAVIAIENVRLFRELGERNAELREALEHQTATAEVLSIISRSPTDVQPVLDAIVESAARVCGIDDVVLRLHEGNATVPRAHFGPIAIVRVEISIDEPQYRWMREHGALHIPDARAQNEFPAIGSGGDFRTYLAVPLRQQGELIGLLGARRTEVRPFTPAQIKLLETFADQAVIAIENVRLFQELQVRNRDLTEALEQQTATSEILRVIASSPTDIQPVLDVVAQNAARLCDAGDSAIWRTDGDKYWLVASHGSTPVPRSEESRAMTRSIPSGRAMIDRETVHIHDILSPESLAEFSESFRAGDIRTVLSTPLLREGVAIGAIHVRRPEVRPFTDKQIALLKTFADQAVIAIENVRLFKELEARNRDLTEALEQQTATSEILRVIASSPTDVQPVLDVVAESAARLCDASDASIFMQVEGALLRKVAAYGPAPTSPIGTEASLNRNSFAGRAIVDRETIHIRDFREVAADYPESRGTRLGYRTMLATPLLREGIPIGVIGMRRSEVQPFTDKQISLVKTFADQAVIAIENVRLFRELKESLEQQTATSEILGVIASSPTDIQPVLEVVAKNAARLCEATDALISRIDGDLSRSVASYGSIPGPRRVGEASRISRGTPAGRAVLERKTIHVHDIAAEIETEFPESKARQQVSGTRTILVTPLLREGVVIGTIVIRRTEVRAFTEKQIKLLETFADQAVIAIENVRLFQELAEALEQQTATSEILRVIASSPTDLQPVMDTVAERAARLCDAIDAQIFRAYGDDLRLVASHGPIPVVSRDEGVPILRGAVTGRAVIERRTIHIHDMAAESVAEFPEGLIYQKRFGHRTILATPLLREGVPIGAIMIRRMEVRPFSEKQIKLLETFADQSVIAIENVRLFQEIQARTRELAQSVGELKALGEVGQAVSSTLDLQTVLSTIVGHAVQLSGANGGVVYEYDEVKQEFHLRASQRMEDQVVEALRATPVRLGQGTTGQAAITRAPVQVSNILEQHESTATTVRPLLARLGYRSVLAVPLLREERIMGALTVWRKEAGDFSQEVVNLLQTFATQSALAIQNARLFREIEEKGKQLEVASRHKSEFLANMSHELRTPLNAIIGFSEVLGERLFGELNEKQAEYTEDILSSGRHLLSLINDILDLSKIEAGRMELEVTTFHLPDAIENALTLIRERASRHGIKLNRVIDDRLGDFTGDERKVKQVLVNLLSNAVKFTPEGGQIRVEASLGDSAVIVSVTDTGIGIAPEDQEAIFEEFRQVGTNYAQKREGTGLGLSLTKKFIELHRGKLWVESEVGKGSKFTFTLPLQ